MLEIGKSGSVRDVDALCMAEYCDTPPIERGEKLGIQSMPKQMSYSTSTRQFSNKNKPNFGQFDVEN